MHTLKTWAKRFSFMAVGALLAVAYLDHQKPRKNPESLTCADRCREMRKEVYSAGGHARSPHPNFEYLVCLNECAAKLTEIKRSVNRTRLERACRQEWLRLARYERE